MQNVVDELDVAYLRQHGVAQILESAIAELLEQKPSDPLSFLINSLDKVRREGVKKASIRVLQVGTTNWQRQGEFAPGSGILHEAHHETYNTLDGVVSYSIYPSTNQESNDFKVRIFKVQEGKMPVFTVVPTSSYKYSDMSESEFANYKATLTQAVENYISEIEAREGAPIDIAVGHHLFINAIILAEIAHKRKSQGKPTFPVVCFVHGTALKMYQGEVKGDLKPRFLQLFRDQTMPALSKIFAISEQQIDLVCEMFPSCPRSKIVLSPNGINHLLFAPDRSLTLPSVLSTLKTAPYEGSGQVATPLPTTGWQKMVVFCGKFADWKRIDALLNAATIYEKAFGGQVITVIAGSGPLPQQKLFMDMAVQLGTRGVFFVGPQDHKTLARLYNVADIGVFPAFQEPMGLVFIECMACGTPVIGANSGGPRDFVTPEVGVLVPEVPGIKNWNDANQSQKDTFYRNLADAIIQSLREDWKRSKGTVCRETAVNKYSLRKQCTNILKEVFYANAVPEFKRRPSREWQQGPVQ